MSAELAIALMASAFAKTGNIELWECSSLISMHAHPVGREGKLLNRAEDKVISRRRDLRPWLETVETAQRLRDSDDMLIEQAHSVYYVGSIPVEDEWRSYRRAKRCVGELEKRRKNAGEAK